MTEPSDELLYEGVTVDVPFSGKHGTFGDLLAMVGVSSAQFPVSGHQDWSQLAGLGFEQADDYFGIAGTTDDYSIWLYPVVDARVVEHHPGPYDGIRLQYNVLRNPADTASTFRHVVLELSRVTMRPAVYGGNALGLPPNLTELDQDIAAVIGYWRDEGIEPGSADALSVDF